MATSALVSRPPQRLWRRQARKERQGTSSFTCRYRIVLSLTCRENGAVPWGSRLFLRRISVKEPFETFRYPPILVSLGMYMHVIMRWRVLSLSHFFKSFGPTRQTAKVSANLWRLFALRLIVSCCRPLRLGSRRLRRVALPIGVPFLLPFFAARTNSSVHPCPCNVGCLRAASSAHLFT